MDVTIKLPPRPAQAIKADGFKLWHTGDGCWELTLINAPCGAICKGTLAKCIDALSELIETNKEALVCLKESAST